MGKHWRFCGTSWMNMKVIHEPDCYGKDNSRTFIRTWMGQSTNLGMYVYSSKTRVISVSFRGWHLNGWREAEDGSHVAEIDARRWSLKNPHHFMTMYIWDVLSWCKPNETLIEQHKEMLNHAFLLGQLKNYQGGGKPHARTVAWSYDMEGQAQKCVEWYCELAKNWSSFTKIQVRPCLGVNTTPTCTRADAHLSRAHLTVHDSCSPIRPLNTGYEPNFYSYLNEEPRRSISVTVSRAVTTPPSSQLPKIQKFLARQDPGAARKPQLAGCHHVGIVRCEPLEAAAWVGWQSCEHSGI